MRFIWFYMANLGCENTNSGNKLNVLNKKGESYEHIKWTEISY